MADPLSIAFVETHPADAARVLEKLSPEDAAAYLQSLPESSGDAVLSDLSVNFLFSCLDYVEPDYTLRVIPLLPLTKAVSLLRKLPEDQRNRLLNELPQNTARQLSQSFQLEEGSIGQKMDPRVAIISDNLLVADAVRIVRETALQLEKYVYAINADGKLTGVIDTRLLLTTEPTLPVKSVMSGSPIALPLRGRIEHVMSHSGWKKFHILPVVDRDGVFHGILRRKILDSITLPQKIRDVSDPGIGNAMLSLAEAFWSAAADVMTVTAKTKRSTKR